MYFLNGPFANVSLQLGSFLLTCVFVITHLNILWLPVQFAYRYRYIGRQGRQVSSIIHYTHGDFRNGRASFGDYAIIASTMVWSIPATFAIYNMFVPSEEFQSVGQRVLLLNGWPLDAEPPFTYGAYVVR